VLICAFGAIYAGIWVPIRVICALVGLGASGLLGAMLIPAGSALERILDSFITVVVLSVVLGLFLNYMPGGLTRHTFAIGWCALGLAFLGAALRGMTLPLPEGATARAISPSLAAAGVLFAAATGGAFVIAGAGVSKQDNRPLLAFSALSYGARSATVEVSSVHEEGAYELTVLPDGLASGGSEVRFHLGTSESKVAVLRLPTADCFWSIEVSAAGASKPLRALKLWVGTSSAGLLRRGSSSPLIGSGGTRLPAACQKP
jgi:hypothetical protein